MAVRAISRNSLGERSDYVYDDDSQTSTLGSYSSSDDESPYITRRKNKVRSAKSIRSLLKESHSYEKSDEHAYTQTAIGGKRVRKNIENDFYKYPVSKKPRIMSKNAINAKINRERKKAYVASLEEEVKNLRVINKSNDSKVVQQETTISSLRQEVAHLKGLLANNKYLCTLVGKLSAATGLPVTSSLVNQLNLDPGPVPAPRTRSVPSGINHPIARKDVNFGSSDMDDFNFPSITEDTESLFPSLDCDELNFDTNEFLPLDYANSEILSDEDFVGICVHINQKRLSVEFCSLCNARAMSA